VGQHYTPASRGTIRPMFHHAFVNFTVRILHDQRPSRIMSSSEHDSSFLFRRRGYRVDRVIGC